MKFILTSSSVFIDCVDTFGEMNRRTLGNTRARNWKFVPSSLIRFMYIILRCSIGFERASWIAISSNADITTFIQLADMEALATLNQEETL
jgi:hypothetical protein